MLIIRLLALLSLQLGIRLVFSIPSNSSNSNSTTSCIRIVLSDAFGDGWDRDLFMMETPTGRMTTLAPNCTTNTISMLNCAEDGEGYYYIMVDNPKSSSPSRNNWEVRADMICICIRVIFPPSG